jgi:branched-chain amino acid transport system ATP-binding protein
MADGEALLRLNGVYTDIGRYQILYGVDLSVQRGRVTMLLGRNGAGKTTTLRTIMALWKARAGAITFDGRSIAGMGRGRSSQKACLLPSATSSIAIRERFPYSSIA